MKQFKLPVLLTVLMSMTILNVFAQSFEVDGIMYYVTSNYTVEVTSNNAGYSGDLVIPATVIYQNTTYSVTKIAEHAFQKCSGLTSVKIPSSVTTIGNHAFFECTSLTSITIPKDITKIAAHTFHDCTSLTSVKIPNSVSIISEWTFSGCENLTTMEIPNSVKAIGQSAFISCI